MAHIFGNWSARLLAGDDVSYHGLAGWLAGGIDREFVTVPQQKIREF